MRAGRRRSWIRGLEPYHDLSADLIAAVDPDGYVVHATPVWERVLGHRVDDLVGRPLVDFVHPDDFRRIAEELRALPEAARGTSVFECRFRRADGGYTPLEWRVRSAPRGRLIHAVARDLSERERFADELNRAREHSELASQAKSDFLSRMSHELRTPLTSVIGFSELLLKDPLEANQKLKLEQILKAGEHLLGLIDEMLDIERVEAGTMTVSPEPIQLGGLLRDAIVLAGPQAAERDIRIEADLEACAGRYVMADPQRLRQAVLNLLSNAVKYNREAGDVRLTTEVADDQVLRIHVADTGAGLTDEQVRRLFVPFDRIGADEAGVEGAGLGLVVSQRLVELMGGRLSANSEPGRGSTFTIELGLTEPSDATAGEEPVPLQLAEEGSLAGRSILYIEDNLANLELVRELLAPSGARLMTARDGRSGFSLARQQHPDLIILDLNLPDLAGEQVLTALQRDTELSGIPVVAVSADASRETRREIYGRGVAAYMTKPFDTDSLIESIERALARDHARAGLGD